MTKQTFRAQKERKNGLFAAVQMIRVEIIAAHDIVRSLCTPFAVVEFLIVGVVRHSHLVRNGDARDVAPAGVTVGRQGYLKAETYVHIHSLRLLGIQSYGTTGEMAYHFVLETYVADEELLGAESELGVKRRAVVVYSRIPAEVEIPAELEVEALPVIIGNQSQLGIKPYLVTGQVPARLQGGAIPVPREGAYSDFTLQIQLPGISETL